MNETNKNHVKKLVKNAADSKVPVDALTWAQAAEHAANALYNVDNMTVETKPEDEKQA